MIMDINIEMYIVGFITTFITCWVLYIRSIKRSFATIKERKTYFIDDIWGMFCGFTLVSLFSWITMIVIMIALLCIAINNFLKYIINDTNFGKFIIYNIFK